MIDSEEEEEDFTDRDEWEAIVNTWTVETPAVYLREFILEKLYHVPDWAFNIKFVAYKYEDPENEELMICEVCNFMYNDGVSNIWKSEGIVEPFDIKSQIYEDEEMWCMRCDKALFKFLDL